jgi:hypothetical protein
MESGWRGKITLVAARDAVMREREMKTLVVDEWISFVVS